VTAPRRRAHDRPRTRAIAAAGVSGTYVKYASPRSIIDPEFAAGTALISNDKLLAGRHASNRRVQAEVASIDTAAKVVRLATGELIAYDHVVLAVGARNASPAQLPASATTAAEIKAHFGLVREAIVAATAVVVVGGGPVGSELAGSVRLANPRSAITVVHAGPSLLGEHLATAPAAKLARFNSELERSLRAANVEVRLNARVEGLRAADCPNGYAVGARTLAISGGVTVAADLVLWCVGNVPATSGLLDRRFLDESGQVRVDRTGRIIGVADSSAFAIGDCCDLSVAKVRCGARGRHDVCGRSLSLFPSLALAHSYTDTYAHPPIRRPTAGAALARRLQHRQRLPANGTRRFGLQEPARACQGAGGQAQVPSEERAADDHFARRQARRRRARRAEVLRCVRLLGARLLSQRGRRATRHLTAVRSARPGATPRPHLAALRYCAS
jgi:thioredoxin reductase